ncbi:hypothetical protein EVAR_39879_1 [Eumeta japonica]|uniref:Uncharacterized protein n=1 Tax=Eumeta variegata TaxID=151549 RepID=A0A4C1WUA4_EUMVA|nr:hypothetical protein EVAR_39879_1 [Eumeta japonica]
MLHRILQLPVGALELKPGRRSIKDDPHLGRPTTFSQRKASRASVKGSFRSCFIHSSSYKFAISHVYGAHYRALAHTTLNQRKANIGPKAGSLGQGKYFCQGTEIRVVVKEQIQGSAMSRMITHVARNAAGAARGETTVKPLLPNSSEELLPWRQVANGLGAQSERPRAGGGGGGGRPRPGPPAAVEPEISVRDIFHTTDNGLGRAVVPAGRRSRFSWRVPGSLLKWGKLFKIKDLGTNSMSAWAKTLAES